MKLAFEPETIAVGETALVKGELLPPGCKLYPEGRTRIDVKDVVYAGHGIKIYRSSDESESFGVTMMEEGTVRAISIRAEMTGETATLTVKPQCTDASLTITRDLILVGETAQANLSFAPVGCVPPKESSTRYSSKSETGSVDVGSLSGEITGLNAGKATIRGSRGDRSAEAEITVNPISQLQACEKLNVHYSGDVAVGEATLEPVVTYTPERCKASEAEQVNRWFSGSPDEHAQVNFLSGVVTGIAPGEFKVTVKQEGVNQPGTTTLQVTPPRCTNLQVIYSPKSIHLPSETASPTPYYSPHGCKVPPDAPIQYDLDPDPQHKQSEDVATVDPATGVVKGKKAGTAHIKASRGRLDTTASVEILPPQ